jgi:predicted phage terminase large subunit-like protein
LNVLLEKLPSLDQIKQEKARRHLINFINYTLPVYSNPQHQILLADKLEAVERGEIKRLMVFMPPRHLKSETCSIRFPAWCLGRNPQRQIIGCSYAEDLAYTFSYAVRETIESNKYQKLWPLKLDKSGAVRWQLEGKDNKRDSYIAAGVGGGITGEGADILIIDDPVKNSEEAESLVYRDKVYQWYGTTARTRLQPGGVVILIMTRWHQDDLAGRLLADAKRDPEADQWEVLHFKAINSQDEALWPDKYSITDLKQTRATIGSRSFTALYQGEPSTAEGNIFKREWWKYYKELPNFKRIIHSWDTAFKAKTENDYSVNTVWGEAQNGYYLLYVWRQKVEYPELKRAAISINDKHHAHAIYIEDKASGQSLVQELSRETRLPLIPVKVDSDKVARAYAVTPLIEAGRVYLPESAPWLHDYVEELSSFPNGEHDDQVDSTTQALNKLSNKTLYGFDIV